MNKTGPSDQLALKSVKNPLNIHDIVSILPHRYPFLLIDKVLYRKRPDDLDHGNWKGSELLAIKNVTINEPYFSGHFPDNPIMPGVMIIETMAQAAALLVEQPHPNQGKWNFVLSRIEKAKFHKPVQPGDCMHLHVQLIKAKRLGGNTIYLFTVEALVDDIKKATSQITAQMW